MHSQLSLSLSQRGNHLPITLAIVIGLFFYVRIRVTVQCLHREYIGQHFMTIIVIFISCHK